jgi:hypothetical protein
MSGAAARATTAALKKGDAKVALAMFKALGVMDPQRQEEPEEVVTIVGERWIEAGKRSAKAGGEMKVVGVRLFEIDRARLGRASTTRPVPVSSLGGAE